METFKKYLPVYLRLCRSVFLYLSFLLLATISSYITRQAHIAVNAVMLLFIYHSTVRVFAETDRITADIALAYRAEVEPLSRSARDILGLIIRQKEFYIEAAVVLLLPILLPLEAGFGYLVAPLLAKGLSRALVKLILVSILVPLGLGVGLLSHYYGFLWWLDEKASPDMHFWRALLLRLLGLLLIYTVGSIAIIFYVPIFISVYYIFVALSEIFKWLPFLIIGGVLLLLWLLAFLRALRIRRKFLRQLRACCAEIGATLSPIRRPYRSLLCLDRFESFTVTRGEKTYHCKLFSARRRRNPLFFSEHGTVQCLHSFSFRRVEYFRFTTQFDFSFEAPAPRILIVNPVSKEIFAGHTHFARPIDTGESVGPYKIFTATGFLGALARDVLDR